MKESLRRMLGAASTLLLIGLFVVAAAPASAGEMDLRIKALEQELTQLKGEQIELKQDALAAKAALPSFKYRPGRGLLIEGADRSWGLRFFLQYMPYMSFWDKNRPRGGAVNGVYHIRRARPRFWYYWDKGFHEFDFWVDIANSGGSGGGSWNAFKANYTAHFEKLNPWFPAFTMGANPSFWLNRQDTNMGSGTAGRSEFTMLSQGNGVVLGTQNRGIRLDWRRLPVGPASVRLNLGYSLLGINAFNSGSGSGLKNDSKTFTWGLGVEPFRKMKNKWIKGIEVSFGGVVRNFAVDSAGGYNIRTLQTRMQRISLIRTDARDAGSQYYTMGFGYRVGPYRLRSSFGVDNSHRETGLRGDDGSSIRGRDFQLLHEIFIWSKKGGFFTGSPRTPSIMISPKYNRTNVRAPNAMAGCSTATTGCQGAYAIDTGVALWYFTGRSTMNFGIVWDHWRVNKANVDVDTRIDKGKTGRSAKWNTITLIMRTTW